MSLFFRLKPRCSGFKEGLRGLLLLAAFALVFLPEAVSFAQESVPSSPMPYETGILPGPDGSGNDGEHPYEVPDMAFPGTGMPVAEREDEETPASDPGLVFEEADFEQAAPDESAADRIPSGRPDSQRLIPPEGDDPPEESAVAGNVEPDTPYVDEIPSIAAPTASDGNDVFYDADQLVPTGEMATKSGPRNIDPVLQPASKFVIVRKNHAADSGEARLVAAQRALKLGRYEAAADLFEMLYKKNRRDPRVLMGRAVTLQHAGRFEAAMQAYEELLELKPDNVAARINMLGLLSEKYPSVALRRLEQLYEESRGDVGVVAQIAVMQAQLGNYDDAIRYLGIAASMEPRNASHVFNMAVIADRAGDKGQAIRYYEEALELDTIYGAGKSIPRESVYERLSYLR